MKAKKSKKFSEKIKNQMLNDMMENYRKDGFLAPVLFAVKNGKPGVTLIPSEFLESKESKYIFSRAIKELCKDPAVSCAGIILECWAKEVNGKDELTKLLMSGNLSVSELKEKKDAIIMVFSTPEKEECFGFWVDPVKKEICEKMGEGERGPVEQEGIFSNFFELRKKVN